jgi:hypothetical protein
VCSVHPSIIGLHVMLLVVAWLWLLSTWVTPLLAVAFLTCANKVGIVTAARCLH